MARIYNFSAGPSMLPEEVLLRAQAEITDYQGSGMSVMEMSHRGPVYERIIGAAEARLRALMAIPDNYRVLFLQGGATLQFAMVPMNLLARSGKADYVLSGNFSTKAYEEALTVTQGAAFQGKGALINVAASTKDENFTRIPSQRELALTKDADYLHICMNNTIYGSKYPYTPDSGSVPLVADMSSCILSEPCDVTKYGLVYAGAQKNVAPAGLTIVIIRDDLLRDPLPGTPVMMNYKVQAKNASMYNTPPAWCIYMALLVFEWLEGLGGLSAMKARNQEKATLLYDYLDSSSFYKTGVAKADRSMMNVTFTTGDKDADARFASEAAAAGLVSLKGHRAVGGMRASIYNAMPKAGVERLIEFMREFERTATRA